jgi:predicted NAD-dependent protein-ADP-ribosyltransferase YbiA (DUF1768 family)
MDIGSGKGYPESALSNFAGHRFTIDGIICNSMEGFLQSLKFSNTDMQIHVCSLIGRAAKFAGSKKNWKTKGILYWDGKSINRFSDEYQTLLNRAYTEMFKQSEGFRNALLASSNATLTHSIGKTDTKDTVLTRAEFCSRLTKLRQYGYI